MFCDLVVILKWADRFATLRMRFRVVLDCQVHNRRVIDELDQWQITCDEKRAELCTKYFLYLIILKYWLNDLSIFECIFAAQLAKLIPTHSKCLVVVIDKNQVLLATCKINYIFINYSMCTQKYCVLPLCSDIKGILPQPTKYLPFLSQQIYSIQECFLFSEVPFLLISLVAMSCLFECDITDSRLRLCLRSLLGVHQFIKITVLKYFRIIIEYRNMSEIQQSELSPDDKKLFNILEIKIYDISQNVEILSRQLMPNQIKEIVAHSFSIFNQLKYFFEKSKVLYLFTLMRKIQINTVLMTTLLTDKLQKQSKLPVTTKMLPAKDNRKQSNQQVYQSEIEIKQKALCKNIRQLGGIYLYNQHYTRGLQNQVNQELLPSSEGTSQKVKNFKRYRQDFLNTIMKEIDNKAEVQVQGINDQIKNYISNYKQNTKMANFISCQKELGEIIDFFKLSELQALNFLNKSPNYNDYTEDYINRLNQMQRDIKVKQKSEKVEILEKMKLFIQKLKQRMVQIQKTYQEKNTKLIQYEKSLKKETNTNGTQTYDNFERRIKDLQNKLKEEQQRYNILNEMRKAELSIEDQVYHLKNQIQVKNNHLKKLEQTNLQLEEDIEYFKKVIRDNKEKLSLPTEPERRRMKSRKKIGKDLTLKKIQGVDDIQKNETLVQEGSVRQRRETRSSELKQFKKARRYEKIGTYNGYRSSYQAENLSQIDKKTQDIRNNFESEQQTPPISVDQKQKLAENKISNSQKPMIGSRYLTFDLQKLAENRFSSSQKPKNLQKIIQKTQANILSTHLSLNTSSQNIKQSIFKQQHKKNTIIRKGEQQSKVSFHMPQNIIALTSEIPQKCQLTPKKIDSDIIRQRSLQQSLQKSRISIQECERQEEEPIRRSQRKNTLKQKLDRSICSIKSIKDIQQFEGRKETRSLSKKCIILKDKKDKNIITTAIKLTNMGIVHQFDLLINELLPKTKKQSSIYEKVRLERPSFPVNLARGSNNVVDDQINKNSSVKSKKKIGLYQLKKKQKVNSKDAGNLHPIKNNKSVGSIIFSHKVANKQDERSILAMQISKDKRNSINNSISALSLLEKRQLTALDKAYIAYLLQKGDVQKFNQEQEQQRIHSNLSISKQIKSGFKKHIQMQNQQKSVSKSISKWKYQDSTFVENGLTKYIMQEIQSQNLNVEELKQIMMMIDASSDPSRTKKMQSEQKHKYEQDTKKRETINNLNNAKNMQKSFVLDGISVAKLREIHEKYSKCAELNKQNKLCHHLQKYVSIVKNISEMHSKYKIPLKLPIQKIGQIDDSHQRQTRNHRTVDQIGQTYLKSNTVTDHFEEQKPRILPIITNTTSGYYKPKNKVVR